jgi:ribose 1,5-bisphosphokinase PhnN
VLAARLAARGREAPAGIAARLARDIALPDSVAVGTIMNDGALDAAVARFVAAIRRSARGG